MKRYDQNVFIAFVMLCVLVLLLSCSTTRHTDTLTTIETRDTIHTHSIDSTTAGADTWCAELRDTLQQTDRVYGSLKIERDTSGRPVLFIWNRSTFLHSTVGKNFDFDRLFVGRTYSCSTDSTATSSKSIEKEEKKATKVGPRLEDYIGTGLMLFVILYIIYVIIENLWRNRNK